MLLTHSLSLELVSVFFHDFFAWGGPAATGKSAWNRPVFCNGKGDAKGEEFRPDLNLLKGRNSRKNTVAWNLVNVLECN